MRKYIAGFYNKVNQAAEGFSAKLRLHLKLIYSVVNFLIIISFIFNITSVNSRLRTENLLKAKLTERIFYTAFDQFNDILKTSNRVIEDNIKILSREFNQLNVDELLLIINQINILKARASYIQEIVFFKKNSDYYITTQGTVSNKEFFNLDYFNVDTDHSYFNKIFYDYNYDTVLPLNEYQKLNNLSDQNTLRLFIIPKIYKIFDVGILILVNEQEFLNYYSVNEKSIDLNISLYNKNGKLIISNSFQNVGTTINTEKIYNIPQKVKSNIFGYFSLMKWFDYENMIYVISKMSLIPSILILNYALLLFLLYLFYLRLKNKFNIVVTGLNSTFTDMGLTEKTSVNDFVKEIDSIKAKISVLKENNNIYKRLELKNYLTGTSSDLNNRIYLNNLNGSKFILLNIIFLNDIQNTGESDVEDFFAKHSIPTVACQSRSNIITLICIFSYSNEELIKGNFYDVINLFKQTFVKNKMIFYYSSIFEDFLYSRNIYKELNIKMLNIRVKDEFVSYNDITNLKSTFLNIPSNISTEISRFISMLNKDGILDYIQTIFSNLRNENITFETLIFCVRYINNIFMQSLIQLNKVNQEIDKIQNLFLITFEKQKYLFNYTNIVNTLTNMVLLSMDNISSKVVNSNINDIVKYIDENYKTELYLDKIASKFNLSPKYFSYYFKKEFNIGFNEYLTQLRIEEAKRLLREDNLSISNISEEVGYINTITFNTAFKKYTGLSPSQYRKKFVK